MCSLPGSPRLIAIAVAVLPAAIAGCGSPGRLATRADLDRATYVAVKANKNPYLSTSKATLTFTNHAVSGAAGGNAVASSEYALDGGRLVLGNSVSGVAGVGRSRRLDQQHAWFTAILQSRPRIYVRDAGRTLTLETSEQRVTFERRSRRSAATQRRIDRGLRRLSHQRELLDARLRAVDERRRAGRIGARASREQRSAIMNTFRSRVDEISAQLDALTGAPPADG